MRFSKQFEKKSTNFFLENTSHGRGSRKQKRKQFLSTASTSASTQKGPSQRFCFQFPSRFRFHITDGKYRSKFKKTPKNNNPPQKNAFWPTLRLPQNTYMEVEAGRESGSGSSSMLPLPLLLPPKKAQVSASASTSSSTSLVTAALVAAWLLGSSPMHWKFNFYHFTFLKFENPSSSVKNRWQFWQQLCY